jgi:hypothetical protein
MLCCESLLHLHQKSPTWARKVRKLLEKSYVLWKSPPRMLENPLSMSEYSIWKNPLQVGCARRHA